MLNPAINFLYEKESNNTIPFVDILIIKSKNVLSSKLFRKTMNINDYMHFPPTAKLKSKQALYLAFIKDHLEYIPNNTYMMNLNTSNTPLKAENNQFFSY